MALMKSAQVPKDAIVLDEIQATTYAWELVSNWESLSDTWALRYSPAILGGINALTGILINKHYRDKLKLGTYGYMSSVIPISAMPGILTALFHRHMISTEMLLMKKEACPICYELRSTAIQLTLGIAYPMVLGPLTSLMLTHRYNTYRIPSLGEPKIMFQFLKKISRPFSGTLVFMGAFQFVASSVLTYFEMKNHLNIRRKMIEIEKKVLEEPNLET